MNSGAALTGVIRQLAANDAAPDSELLARYATHRDEAAFAAVVERYGGLVLGVARRQLAHPHTADDVFQATFLALARSASRLHERTPLANWLYTVALRQARKARARDARRTAVEQSLPPRPASADPLTDITGRDLVRLIDEEVARLPEKYRQPVLLCCVRGLSRDEAAGALGLSLHRLKGRLERGRKRLAERLTSRGLAPAALLLGTVGVPADLSARAVSHAVNPWARSIPADVSSLVHTGGVRGWALAAAVALVPFGLAGWAIGLTPRPREEAAPMTALADPAPPANIRFGTANFRHGTEITTLAVSPDGKRAVACSADHWLGGLRGYDLTDGKAVFLLGGEFQRGESVTMSPDGRVVAVKNAKKIGLFDAATGDHIRTIDHGPQPNGVSTSSPWLTFSPDGKTIAFIGGHGDDAGKKLILVDVDTGNVATTLTTGNMVYGAAFSPDGKRLVAGGHDNDKGGYFARQWDLTTGTELRQLRHGNASLRAVAYSPDGKTIAGAGDDGWLRIWDADTGKELHSLPQPTRRVYSVAFSPDGKTLAAAGGDKLRLIDTATTQVTRTIDRKATGLHFTADGKTLTAAVAGAIHRWDVSTGEQLTPTGSDSGIDQVALTPDGKRLLTQDQSGEMHLWDAVTGKHLRRWKGSYQRGFALSPDGRFVAWPVEDESVKYPDPANASWIHTGHRMTLYDLAEGKAIDRFGGFKGDAHESTFTPEGKGLVTVDRNQGTATVWDLESGKERRSFPLTRPDEKARAYFVNEARLSPDGKTLAVTYNRPDRTTALFGAVVARLWDVATGKELHELQGHTNRIDGAAFSPDGKYLATCGESGAGTGLCSVWEVATGARATWLGDQTAGASGVVVAFSRDGRTLATATGSGTVTLWEVATWKKRGEAKPHRDRIGVMVFAADGRLFTGGMDTTTAATVVRPRVPVTPVANPWDDLARADGAAGFAAQGQLLADPAKAVALLAEKLKPVPPPDAKELAGLVADLDSPDFATREAASKRLRDIGGAATGVLRAATQSDSPEVRKRAGQLLALAESSSLSPAELRVVRAVEVLEWLGTADARKLLSDLAAGAPGARVTTEAKAAAGRVARP